MPCPHFDIKVVGRSEGQSAVAAAAYQSGEKLYSQYDKETKSYDAKEGITHTEIMLPSNAPREYADRNTLWNAVEKIENQWNSQLARRFHLPIPREIPEEQYVQLVREYCNEFFVSKGMIADIAIHDPHPPGHNPHTHVLVTMRAMDENGKWLPKARKVYDLDENGERIRLPSGNWKSHKENTVDWNERKYGMIWRMGWQDFQNKYLEANNRPERVDLRSYEAQGIDQIPTVHMGPAVTAMERRGIQTDIGNLNREIRKTNSIMQSIKQMIRNLRNWLVELNECRKELIAEQAELEANMLPKVLMKYLDIRKAERSDWTPQGRSKAASQDLKKVSEAIGYLKRQGLHTVDDLEAHIEKSGEKAANLRDQMKKKESRVKTIDSKRDYAIVTLYVYTGIRRSECVSLRLDQVDLISREIRIVGKGNKQRIVYINDKVVHAIREYLKERNSNSPYLFVSRQSEKLTPSRINQIFNQYSDSITPKTLRHYFCSNALENGYSIHEVANQAGHSNVQTTLIYSNPTAKEMKDKANRL